MFYRLLDPDLESSGSLFVGSYILQLILHLPSQMSLHIHELVASVVWRMQSCEISGLKSSLIVILARLVIILLRVSFFLLTFCCFTMSVYLIVYSIPFGILSFKCQRNVTFYFTVKIYLMLSVCLS